MPSYSEFVAYSPRHDAEMCRLSMWDAEGMEHFLLVKPYGRIPLGEPPLVVGWADRRRVCTFVLLDHIETKQPAGEVACPDDDEMRDMVLELQGIRNARQQESQHASA